MQFFHKTKESLCTGTHTLIAPIFITVPSVGTNLVIALDGSRSVKPEDFMKMKDSVKEIINSLIVSPQDSRVGVMEYSDQVNVVFHLNKYPNNKDIIDAIDGIQPSLGNGRVLDEVQQQH